MSGFTPMELTSLYKENPAMFNQPKTGPAKTPGPKENMKHRTTLLQISFTNGDCLGGTTTFKCTACQSIFRLDLDAGYKFCPFCGDKGGMTFRKVEAPQRYPSCLYSAPGSVQAEPSFRLAVEFWAADSSGDHPSVLESGSHRHLARIAKIAKSICEGCRFSLRLIPSKPLALP